MIERNKQMNFLSVRRAVSHTALFDLRSTGYYLPSLDYGYSYSYTGGLFTFGRSYRSQAA